jgi:hypothetical protein
LKSRRGSGKRARRLGPHFRQDRRSARGRGGQVRRLRLHLLQDRLDLLQNRLHLLQAAVTAAGIAPVATSAL